MSQKSILFAVALGTVSCSALHAAPATFAVDPVGSSATLSGSVNGAAITQQGPGSLTTTYFGTALVNLSSASVQFVNGGSTIANNSGSWQPLPGGLAGNAPANYGAQVNLGIFGTGRLAVRDLSVDASSDPLTLTGNSFTAAGVNFVLNSGTADFSSVLTTGSEPLAGLTAVNSAGGNGTLAIAVNTLANTATATITLPLAASFVASGTLGTATLNLTGQTLGRVSSIGGDANFDLIVDIGDFATLAANFNQPGSWLAGNFDDAGNIDIGDFAILAANFNETAPPLSRNVVPEPSGAALALAPLVMRRRRAGRRRA